MIGVGYGPDGFKIVNEAVLKLKYCNEVFVILNFIIIVTFQYVICKMLCTTFINN